MMSGNILLKQGLQSVTLGDPGPLMVAEVGVTRNRVFAHAQNVELCDFSKVFGDGIDRRPVTEGESTAGMHVSPISDRTWDDD